MKKNNIAPDGLILLHKRPGVTSFDALRDIKRLIGSGKAGHTGTLDKFAEGLLLVLTGRALKLSRWFTHCDKQYEGTIRFGAETDTIDPEGSVIATAPLPTREAVEQAISRFTGEIEQAPPAYSAIHIDGERASTLARRGEAPEMRKRPVTIYRLELVAWEPPDARIFVHCSGGTYIRSLARDIALAAGSRAHLSALLRTQVAGFKLENAVLGTGDWGSGNGENAGSREWGLGNGECSSDDYSASGLYPGISNKNPQSLRLIDKGVFAALNIPCVDISTDDARKVIQGKPLEALSALDPLLFQRPAAHPNGVFQEYCGSSSAIALFSQDAFIAIIERGDDRWNYGYVYARK